MSLKSTLAQNKAHKFYVEAFSVLLRHISTCESRKIHIQISNVLFLERFTKLYNC